MEHLNALTNAINLALVFMDQNLNFYTFLDLFWRPHTEFTGSLLYSNRHNVHASTPGDDNPVWKFIMFFYNFLKNFFFITLGKYVTPSSFLIFNARFCLIVIGVYLTVVMFIALFIFVYLFYDFFLKSTKNNFFFNKKK